MRRSLETSDKRRALALCAMLRTLGDGKRWELLNPIAAGELALTDVYQAWATGTLADLVAARAAAANDPDLEPYVAEWYAATKAQRPKTAEEYLRMVRSLLPAGHRFPRSHFRKATIREWLDRCTAGTRNRYRTGASSFAAYLCERELLEFNVVLSVKASAERPPRARYLTRAEAQALVAALPQPHRALHALLLATGADVGGALQIRYRDVDATKGEVRIPGTKAHTRDAVRRMTEEWARDEFLAWMKANPALPLTLVFSALLEGDETPDGIARAQWRTLYQLRQACALETVKLSDYTTRDHRHTYAVQALRDGYSYAVVARQLGHATTALAHKVYGRHVPEAGDYARRTTTVSSDQAAGPTAGQGTRAPKGRASKAAGE